MLDTVKLFTRSFELEKTNKFKFSTEADCNGEITKERCFCNIINGHFDIKENDGVKSLFFTTSLPKLIYGTSLKELKENDFEQCLEAVEGRFQEAGAYIDKKDFQVLPVSRLDYCRNVEVKHSIVDYLFTMKDATFSRREKMNWKNETLLWKNGSQQFEIYNKILEIKNNENQSIAAGVNSDTLENILRFESRFLKAEAIKRALKCRTFTEVWNFENAKKKILNDFDNIVLHIGCQIDINFQSDVELLISLREKGRNAWLAFKGDYGTNTFLSKYNYDMDLIKKLLLNVFQKWQVYNILKELKKFIAEHKTREERNLLEEIRYKLAA